MKVLIINSVCGFGSTGKICEGIAEQLTKQGHTVKIAYGRGNASNSSKNYSIKIGSNLSVKIDALKSRLFDNAGFNSKIATKKFLKWADEFNPDLVWLHNIHGYYVNVEMLFEWIKSKQNLSVKWTLHDCWAFTGHCTHFDFVNCSKWQTACENCSQKGRYPKSILKDNSKSNFQRKKGAFTGVKNLSIITPSKWLAEKVRQSFLKEYSVEVIENRVNQDVFKPTQSDFRKEYGLENKKIILGVASVWEERKGLKDFIKLSNILKDDQVIVLVGLNKKQVKQMPKNIIALPRTASAERLAEIYSVADIFFNPTYEDNYPTVNLEAESCGTRVVTYKTGGAVETVKREDSVIIEKGDYTKVPNLL